MKPTLFHPSFCEKRCPVCTKARQGNRFAKFLQRIETAVTFGGCPWGRARLRKYGVRPDEMLPSMQGADPVRPKPPDSGSTLVLDYATPDLTKRQVTLGMAALRVFIGTVAFVVCAIGGQFLPTMWEGLGGRDFRPQATNSAILILLLSVALRAWRRWRIVEFVGVLAVVEVITLLAISCFSGFTGVDLLHWFNLSWLRDLNMFTGLPWLVGLLLGSVVLWFRKRT